MSWFYRKFFKSDDDSTVTLESDNIVFKGAVTQTGNQGVTGNLTVTGNERFNTAAGPVIYLNTGTLCIAWATSGFNPITTGINDVDKGSILLGGTANLYMKTGYASTAWASVDIYD